METTTATDLEQIPCEAGELDIVDAVHMLFAAVTQVRCVKVRLVMIYHFYSSIYIYMCIYVYITQYVMYSVYISVCMSISYLCIYIYIYTHVRHIISDLYATGYVYTYIYIYNMSKGCRR